MKYLLTLSVALLASAVTVSSFPKPDDTKKTVFLIVPDLHDDSSNLNSLEWTPNDAAEAKAKKLLTSRPFQKEEPLPTLMEFDFSLKTSADNNKTSVDSLSDVGDPNQNVLSNVVHVLTNFASSMMMLFSNLFS